MILSLSVTDFFCGYPRARVFLPSLVSIWSLFWEIWCNQVLSISGVVRVLNGVPRVSSWIFWIFWIFFWIFFIIYFLLNFFKKLKIFHVSSRHRVTWQCTCHMAGTKLKMKKWHLHNSDTWHCHCHVARCQLDTCQFFYYFFKILKKINK